MHSRNYSFQTCLRFSIKIKSAIEPLHLSSNYEYTEDKSINLHKQPFKAANLKSNLKLNFSAIMRTNRAFSSTLRIEYSSNQPLESSFFYTLAYAQPQANGTQDVIRNIGQRAFILNRETGILFVLSTFKYCFSIWNIALRQRRRFSE